MTTTASPSLRQRVRRWLRFDGVVEPNPIVLGQGRIYVLPTRAGLAFIVALLIMLLTSINYTLSLGYGMVFLLGALMTVSAFHAFRTLFRLRIAAGRANAVFAGDRADFELILHNDEARRRPALVARIDRVDEHVRSTDLAPHSHAITQVSRPATARGWLPLGRVVIETTYPLGLIRAWSVLFPAARCLIYPQPEAHPPPLPDDASEVGQRRSIDTAARGDSDFAGLRSHDRADSPRHIAWKVVARDGPLLTKHFSQNRGTTLTLDWNTLSRELDREARICRLTAWVLAADRTQRPYSLTLPGAYLAASTGSAHLHACLSRLALFGRDSDPSSTHETL